MAEPRKKWRVEPDRGWVPASFPSQPKAYEYVRKVTAQPTGATRIQVLVDERKGRGWEMFEVLELGVDFGGETVTDIESDEQREAEDMLAHYMAALDEVYRLRVGAAWECARLDRVLDFATLPVAARRILTDVRVRLANAAQGHPVPAWQQIAASDGKLALRSVGASETLTRHEWEERNR